MTYSYIADRDYIAYKQVNISYSFTTVSLQTATVTAQSQHTTVIATSDVMQLIIQ